jgi:hypothetical protein
VRRSRGYDAFSLVGLEVRSQAFQRKFLFAPSPISLHSILIRDRSEGVWQGESGFGEYRSCRFGAPPSAVPADFSIAICAAANRTIDVRHRISTPCERGVSPAVVISLCRSLCMPIDAKAQGITNCNMKYKLCSAELTVAPNA